MPIPRTQLATLCLISAVLTGCASKNSLLPQDGKPMDQIYQEHMGMTDPGELRLQRRALQATQPQSTSYRPEQDLSPFVRTALLETTGQFRRLPNPDLVMFSFPHLATGDQVPIPGYSTVFPLYERPEYAMPGEPVE